MNETSKMFVLLILIRFYSFSMSKYLSFFANFYWFWRFWMRDYYQDLLILIKFHTFSISKHLYFLLILIAFKVFQCHCDIFVQSCEAKLANQHKIDTPTFSQISEGKWGIESKTISHVYVKFLFKAAKLNGPISTKLTHLLFHRFLTFTRRSFPTLDSTTSCHLLI